MVGSFKVDHTKLGRGIYLSKAQVVGNADIIVVLMSLGIS